MQNSVRKLFDLTGRTAVVTGGTRGIGHAIALALAEAGADVALISRQGQADQLLHDLKARGRRGWNYTVDLGQPDQRTGLIERIAAETGSVDLFVHAAGIAQRHPPEDYPLEEWHALLEVHLHAAFDLSQQAARHMLPKGRGKIVLVGSVISFQGGHFIPAYAAAKHGMLGLTQSLANAWAARGINVNCLCPGYIVTDLSGSLQHDPVRGRQILERIPAGRWGEPQELGGAAVFLCSDASNYMHGASLVIDGGWLSR